MTYTSAPGVNSPALHHFTGLGIDLHFQDGPVGIHGQNGTTNEELIQVLLDRITSLNTMENGRFACPENEQTLTYLRAALRALDLRTQRRQLRGVEGTYEP